VPFVKMHGLGNDFVIVDARGSAYVGEPAAFARTVCDRRLGVGADGVLLIGRGDEASAGAVEVWNADGSAGGMCGNGLRCVATLLRERDGLGAAFSLEMGGRTVAIECGADAVSVCLGEPVLELAQVPIDVAHVDAREGDWVVVDGMRGMAVSMGNPHFVAFVDRLPDGAELALRGGALERHRAFPDGVNLQCVEIASEDGVRVTTWERGSGATSACASGACAVVVCGVRAGLLARRVGVRMPGGILSVDYREDGAVWCAGPAAYVFEGVWPVGSGGRDA
jgi:diaminopimelate epimerase